MVLPHEEWKLLYRACMNKKKRLRPRRKQSTTTPAADKARASPHGQPFDRFHTHTLWSTRVYTISGLLHLGYTHSAHPHLAAPAFRYKDKGVQRMAVQQHVPCSTSFSAPLLRSVDNLLRGNKSSLPTTATSAVNHQNTCSTEAAWPRFLRRP